ncbi:MAG: ArsC family reductase [Stagnimonas sp.]|nr:ArsC family reductase [Stagnimonas sp.]
MLVVYGIKNCDTVQRARQRLDEAGIAYRFHDFKAEGLSAATAQRWIDALGVDVVVNRKGTTWRKLDAATQAGLTAANAAALLAREPSLVKRPVFATPDGRLLIGFAKGQEAALIAQLR